MSMATKNKRMSAQELKRRLKLTVGEKTAEWNKTREGKRQNKKK